MFPQEHGERQHGCLELMSQCSIYDLILLQCYSAKELLESFSVDSNGLNLDKFEKVCPAIVQQIESKACLDEIEDTKKDVKQSKARGTTVCNM